MKSEQDGLYHDGGSYLDGILPPPGYQLTASGVCKPTPPEKPEASPIQITYKPVWVEGRTRDTAGGEWGLLVALHDDDDRRCEVTFPARLLVTPGNPVPQLLSDAGLRINQSRVGLLLDYLSAFDTTVRVRAASSTGWHGGAFVLPREVIGEPDHDERLVYQPTGFSAAAEAIKPHGDAQTWRDGMTGAPAEVVFGVCAALTAPVRYVLEIEAGGFHFFGATTRGKTTLLQAAASVWGNGADPAVAGGGGYIQRWNATGNALEGMASGFNDLPLIVDEIGESDGKAFGATIYRIMSGTGRGRANRGGELRQPRAWRANLLSAGEVSVEGYIGENGRGARGGQLVRLVDIPVGSIFADKAAADAMKSLCSKNYGHAGPRMLRELDVEGIRARWGEFDRGAVGETPTPSSGRVRDRFAVVMFAGQEASRLGVVPWSVDQVADACRALYARWLGLGTGVSEGARGVANVRAFLMRFGSSRFERPAQFKEGKEGVYEAYKRDPVDRAGWFREECYCFAPEVFNEACDGADPGSVKRELRKRGWLSFNHGLQKRIRPDGTTGPRVYTVAVRDSILTGGRPDPDPDSAPVPTFSSDGNSKNTKNEWGQGEPAPSPRRGLSPCAPVSPLKNSELRKKTGGDSPVDPREPTRCVDCRSFNPTNQVCNSGSDPRTMEARRSIKIAPVDYHAEPCPVYSPVGLVEAES